MGLWKGVKIEGECDIDKESDLPYCEIREVDNKGNVLGRARANVGVTKEGEVHLLNPVTWTNEELKKKLSQVIPEMWGASGGELTPIKRRFEETIKG